MASVMVSHHVLYPKDKEALKGSVVAGWDTI